MPREARCRSDYGLTEAGRYEPAAFNNTVQFLLDIPGPLDISTIGPTNAIITALPDSRHATVCRSHGERSVETRGGRVVYVRRLQFVSTRGDIHRRVEPT